MDFVWMILIGLAAGALAKAIVPGERSEPKGCLMTSLLGIGGSLLVGFIMKTLLGADTSDNLIGTLIGATIGAILIILVSRKLWTSRPAA